MNYLPMPIKTSASTPEGQWSGQGELLGSSLLVVRGRSVVARVIRAFLVPIRTSATTPRRRWDKFPCCPTVVQAAPYFPGLRGSCDLSLAVPGAGDQIFKSSKPWRFFRQKFQGLEVFVGKVPRFGSFERKSSKVWKFLSGNFQPLEMLFPTIPRAADLHPRTFKG